MNITVFSTDVGYLIKQNRFDDLLKQLPVSLHEKALRYRTDQSAYCYVVGRLLLKHGLHHFDLDTDLEKIQFQENGKPLLPNIHFNISHSDHLVICGFGQEGQLGLDVEKIKPIDFTDFTSVFTEKEWKAIQESTDPLRSFYWFWTRKESIIKALGRNLNYLHQIELDVTLDHFEVEGRRWYLQQLDLGMEHIGAVCCEKEIDQIELIKVRF